MAYRSSSTANGTSVSSIAITPPSGLADNDILVLFMFGVGTVSPNSYPSGFTQVVSQTATTSNYTCTYAWKRASGESGNYTVGYAASNAELHGILLAFSGRATSGDPNNVAATSRADAGSGSLAYYPAITPANNNCDVVVMTVTYYGPNGTITAPSGMTVRANDYMSVASVTQTTATAVSAGSTDNWFPTSESVGISLALSESSGAAATSLPPIRLGARAFAGLIVR